MPDLVPPGVNPFSSFLQRNKEQIRNVLVGSGVGSALLGAGGVLASKGKTPRKRNKDLVRNLGLGAVLGGLGGGAVYPILNYFNSPPPKINYADKIVGRALSTPLTWGVGGAGALQMAARRLAAQGLNVGKFNRGGGGSMAGDTVKDVETEFKRLVDAGLKPGTPATGTTAAIPGGALTNPIGNTARNAVMDDLHLWAKKLKGQANGQSLLLNPVARALGLDLTPIGGERALINQASRLRDPSLLKQFTGATGVADSKDVVSKSIWQAQQGLKPRFGDALRRAQLRGYGGRAFMGLSAAEIIRRLFFS